MPKKLKENRESLGAALQRHDDDRRKRLLSGCLQTSSWDALVAPPQAVSDVEYAQVEDLFRSAQKRLVAAIVEDWAFDDVVIAESGRPSAGFVQMAPAAATLERVCWPLLVSEALQLESNVFHDLWRQLCDWAWSEQLVLELELVHDQATAKAEYRLRARSAWRRAESKAAE